MDMLAPAAATIPTESPSRARAQAVWCSRLASALRTTLACAIVACTKYYTPSHAGKQIAFPALSYVTAILIVTDATLGEALHGAVCALTGTLQGVAPAILALRVVGPSRFNMAVAAIAVGLSSFVVALPGSTHVITKRVALAEIVIVYVVTYMQGARTEVIMLPLQVGASAMLGASAAVIALLVPYPRLARWEVREKSKLCVEIISEKLKYSVNAFYAENGTSAAASVSQVRSLGKTSNKLLQAIKSKQASIQWESLRIGCSSFHLISASQRLQAMEMPLKGMELALSHMPIFPVQLADEEFKALLLSLTNNISRTLDQITTNPRPIKSSDVHKTDANKEIPSNSLHPITVQFLTHQDLPPLFFLFCMKSLLKETTTIPSLEISPVKTLVTPTEENTVNFHKQEPPTIESILSSGHMRVLRSRFMTAFKCSLILGLSVLLGMLFSKGNGYWAGLAVAVGMAPVREATYRGANLRAQGTVLGSVYGVLGCFIPERLMVMRFLILFPWFIFTSFLKCSRMYGPIGGISAAIAAILIMGRKNYGTPNEFAIMRITETFIGLSCSIVVELLLQPVRASSLTKVKFSEILKSLQESVQLFSSSGGWRGNMDTLRGKVNEMGKFIEEAEMEPNFWFLPFPSPCYRKILMNITKMADLLYFGSLSLELLAQASPSIGVSWKDMFPGIDSDLKMFQKLMGSSTRHFEEVAGIKSLAKLEKEFDKANESSDVESQKAGKSIMHKSLCVDLGEMEKLVSSFLQHAKELMSTMATFDSSEEVKSSLVLCLGTLGFCMENLIKETQEIEKELRELLQWENPSRHINLYDTICKIKYLST